MKKLFITVISITIIGIIGFFIYNSMQQNTIEVAQDNKVKSISKSKSYSKSESQSIKLDEQSVSSSKKAEAERKLAEEQAAGITPANVVQHEMVAPFDSTKPKTVFLTFDDGPSTQITPQVLDTLKKENIKATFFVVGNQIGPNTAPILKRIQAEGHQIGIHSFTHTYNFEKTGNVPQTATELNNTVNAIKIVLGPDFKTTAWRYPGGHMSWASTLAAPDRYLLSQGYSWIDWNAAVGDAMGAKSPRTPKGEMDYLKYSITGYGPHNATVVLMHDSNPHLTTLQTLPQVIAYFKANNYRFGTIK